MAKDLFAAIPSIFNMDDGQDMPAERRPEASLADLHPFKGHPYHVRDDAKMFELAESIAQNGVWEPAIVRPRREGGYEIIAGHRRKRACVIAGLTSMPIDVRDVDDDTATIMMVDTNNKREDLSPREKAYAYKMRMDAKKRQGARTDLTSSQVETRLRSDELIAKAAGESRAQIQRYIRLTKLCDELLSMVDAKQLPLNVGVELSFLNPDEQGMLIKTMRASETKPNIKQAKLFKGLSLQGSFSEQAILPVLKPNKPPLPKKILETSEIKHFFPQDFSAKKIEQVILELLKQWAHANNTRST